MLTLKSPRHMIASIIHVAQAWFYKMQIRKCTSRTIYADDHHPSKMEKHNNNVSESIHRQDAQVDRGELKRVIDI